MIKYQTGNVVESDIDGLKILPHIVNTCGSFSSGVVVSIAKKWPHVKQAYHDFYDETFYDDVEFTDNQIPWMLGEVQFVRGDDNWIIGNMIGQKTPGGDKIGETYLPPIRMDSLRECMLRVADLARKIKAKIVTCKFGSLRAGGKWEDIEKLINELWSDLDVTVYEYKE